MEAFKACGYEDNDFQELLRDIGQMGAADFTAWVPAAVLPRGRAKIPVLLGILLDCGAVPHPKAACSPASAPEVHSKGDSLYLGRVVAAAVRQDNKALEELAEQADPLDELRSLVKAAGQGEPLKEMEPDENGLRAAKSAAKSKRFIKFESAEAEHAAKLLRQLPQLICQELPTLWAAALSGRCAWGDVLNWVGQIAIAANDKAVASPLVAERAAALYGHRLLRDAHTSSKRGTSETDGMENVSRIFGEVDWSSLQRCQAEQTQGTGKKTDASTEENLLDVCGRWSEIAKDTDVNSVTAVRFARLLKLERGDASRITF